MSASPANRPARAIAACVLANLVDGFDVLAIAFTAPAIAREWSLGPQLLGIIFGAGIAGITLGSLLIAPFAERVGRRRLTIGALTAMAVSMLACAFAVDGIQLAALRFITGLGVGAILPTLNSVVAESAGATRRNLAVSVFTAAYPLGSVLGGALAVLLITSHGWQSVFVTGAMATAGVALLHWAWLPAALPTNKQSRINQGLGELTRAPLAAPTAMLGAAFFLLMLSVFFLLNWTPRLLELAGHGARAGAQLAIVINIGSMFGGLTYGLLADRFGWRIMAPTYAVCFALALAAFGAVVSERSLVLMLAGPLGFCMGGAMTSLYALAPVVFPPALRIGATGLVIGIGRLGGVLGPLLAAYGLAAGFGAGALYVAAAAGPAAVAVATIMLGRLRHHPVLDEGGGDVPMSPGRKGRPRQEAR